MLAVYAQESSAPVIVRVLRVKVRAGKVAAFDALFRRQVDLLRAQPGLEYVKFARRLEPDGGEEAVLFEEWRNARSLYAWVGANLATPRLVPGARELMDELIVTHYEALDRDAMADDEAVGVGDEDVGGAQAQEAAGAG
jgi:quinol monooxygenase YgiN